GGDDVGKTVSIHCKKMEYFDLGRINISPFEFFATFLLNAPLVVVWSSISVFPFALSVLFKGYWGHVLIYFVFAGLVIGVYLSLIKRLSAHQEGRRAMTRAMDAGFGLRLLSLGAGCLILYGWYALMAQCLAWAGPLPGSVDGFPAFLPPLVGFSIGAMALLAEWVRSFRQGQAPVGAAAPLSSPKPVAQPDELPASDFHGPGPVGGPSESPRRAHLQMIVVCAAAFTIITTALVNLPAAPVPWIGVAASVIIAVLVICLAIPSEPGTEAGRSNGLFSMAGLLLSAVPVLGMLVLGGGIVIAGVAGTGSAAASLIMALPTAWAAALYAQATLRRAGGYVRIDQSDAPAALGPLTMGIADGNHWFPILTRHQRAWGTIIATIVYMVAMGIALLLVGASGPEWGLVPAAGMVGAGIAWHLGMMSRSGLIICEHGMARLRFDGDGKAQVLEQVMFGQQAFLYGSVHHRDMNGVDTGRRHYDLTWSDDRGRVLLKIKREVSDTSPRDRGAWIPLMEMAIQGWGNNVKAQMQAAATGGPALLFPIGRPMRHALVLSHAGWHLDEGERQTRVERITVSKGVVSAVLSDGEKREWSLATVGNGTFIDGRLG
ncbi:hypothetical protein, partial [Asticcacaulis sp.]|uniref:hypothetical protein n=1 Tax=Asticcacaulis sp. TaxID=1872648 RepID=UPI00261FE319